MVEHSDPSPEALEFLAKVKHLKRDPRFPRVRVRTMIRTHQNWYTVTFSSQYLSATCLATIRMTLDGARTVKIETESRLLSHDGGFCPLATQSDMVAATTPILQAIAEVNR